MSTMNMTGGSTVSSAQEPQADGYVKEFTRHASDVLLNLNELRHRNILTDATLVVGSVHLRAHCAVLVACSGFFYSLYSHRFLLHKRSSSSAEQQQQLMTISLPDSLDPSSISLLLDFMYTSRLPLTLSMVPGVLSAATYLQMDHVADTCREFMQLHRDSLSVRHTQLEPDSNLSVAPVSPKRGTLPPPGPHKFIAAEVVTRGPADVGSALNPGASPTCQQGLKVLKGEPESPQTATPVPSPDSPARSSCHPNSPAESNTCNKNLVNDVKALPDPKACNWKKYKYIVLNPLCAATAMKEEQLEEVPRRTPPAAADRMRFTPITPTEAWSGEVPGQINRQGQDSCYKGSGRAPPLGPHPSVLHPTVPSTHKEEIEASHHNQRAIKHENYYVPFCYSGNLGAKTVCSGDKPYRCNVCGAQFNRPANLKTHSRIHSGEKPYRCDTCGARFVQVAHLRAHVLIHTGEKPYPCHTCGTRFRHLQTLKSHLRIHTGEKPYTCDKCDVHFRHKSQLRLHLRQKHGAVTNTKVRYKLLTEPYQPVVQAC